VAFGCCGGTTRPGRVRIWNTRSHEEKTAVTVQGWLDAMAWTADGTQVATVSANSELALWDATSGIQVHRIPYAMAAEDVSQVAIAPDCNLAVVEEGRIPQVNPTMIRIARWTPPWLDHWFAQSWRCVILDLHNGRRLATLPWDHRFLAFSDDGSTLITYSFDGHLQYWDLPPPRPWVQIIGWAFSMGLIVFVLGQVTGVLSRHLRR
jgi:WD40 repeat protein